MTEWPVEFRFGGLGGQGVVTLGAVLADAGARAGLEAAASQSYGSSARGGATRADVILSDDAIDFPHVHRPRFLAILAQEAFESYAAETDPEGLICYDGFFVKPDDRARAQLRSVPATEIAVREIGNKVAANFIMLGAMLGAIDLIDPERMQEAIRHLVRERFLQANLKAFGLGLDLGRALPFAKEGS